MKELKKRVAAAEKRLAADPENESLAHELDRAKRPVERIGRLQAQIAKLQAKLKDNPAGPKVPRCRERLGELEAALESWARFGVENVATKDRPGIVIGVPAGGATYGGQ